MDEYVTILPSTYDELALDFEWYEQVRLELIKPMLHGNDDVLDVGSGDGGTLIRIADSIRTGVGVDLDSDAVRSAAERARALGLHHLRFEHADAACLPLPDESYDLVLILGDTISYANLFGRIDVVFHEAKRVLRSNGTLVVDGMNWSWEYAESPEWSFFLRGRDNSYTFCSAARTPEGLETIEEFPVLRSTPLHDWLSGLTWPASPQGARTSIDVRVKAPLPRAWLGDASSETCRYFTADSLEQELRKHGFNHPRAVCYGLTYDVVSKAGLTEALRQHLPRLARAEAELVRTISPGAGPWLFASATKRT